MATFLTRLIGMGFLGEKTTPSHSVARLVLNNFQIFFFLTLLLCVCFDRVYE
jgi:hypothetical protein